MKALLRSQLVSVVSSNNEQQTIRRGSQSAPQTMAYHGSLPSTDLAATGADAGDRLLERDRH
ncbi:MAG TPA: hypothetical protein V6C98_01100 [Thermosynechococcaceae cyanobacterium]